MKTRSHRKQDQRTLRTCRRCGHEGDDVHRVRLRAPNGRVMNKPLCEKCRAYAAREERDADERRSSVERARENYRRQGRS